MYNATVKIIQRSQQNMVFRVYPESAKIKYRGGQYGALGLKLSHLRVDGKGCGPSEDKLIKRAYSVSSSLLEDNRELVSPDAQGYYEFFIDLVTNDDTKKPRLSPRIFALEDGDPIFIGPKIVGHYTLEPVENGRNFLFISTTTGESPHNSMIVEALGAGGKVSICNISLWPEGYGSMYKDKHEMLNKKFPNYRYRPFQGSGFQSVEDFIGRSLNDAAFSRENIGWELNKASTHIFLCGDPRMIGAPIKLGAWKYEYPEYGLMKFFEAAGFVPVTRFKPGNISYESYW